MPILLDEQDGIIAGHGRVLAAQKLEIETVPCMVAVGWSEAKKRAYILADNQLPQLAGWDLDVLKVELGELNELDFDLGLTGFERQAIDDWLAPPAEEKAKELADADAFDVIKDVPVTRGGDIWLLGSHRVICGDSLEVDVVGVLLGGAKAQVTFTDPPYNVDVASVNENPRKRNDGKSIENDSMDPAAWKAFCTAVAALVSTWTDGCVYVCHAPGPDGRVMGMALDIAMHASTTVLWVKDVFTLGRGKYHNRYEPIWFGWPGDGTRFTDARDLDNVWEIPRPRASEEHPTMKPTAIMARAMEHASAIGDIVLDPFLGSGSTLMAAEILGRACYGIEIEPLYVDVVVRRWQEKTGMSATLEAGGATFDAVAHERGE